MGNERASDVTPYVMDTVYIETLHARKKLDNSESPDDKSNVHDDSPVSLFRLAEGERRRRKGQQW